MRITCPNCTAHFEIPSELLGRKGRSLKCASCGHSWYQTPQVETIDLAEIMGEEYAARARVDMGMPARGSSPAAQQRQQPQQRQQQQQQPRGYPTPPPMQPAMAQQRGPQGQPPQPGAVSLMRGGPAQTPQFNQNAWGNQQRVQQAAPPWNQQAPPPGGMPGAPPGTPNWYQQQQALGMGAQGQNPPWAQQQQRPGLDVGGYAQPGPGGQVMGPPGATPAWYQPGAVGQPGYPPPGYGPQSMMAGPGQQAPAGWMPDPGQMLAQQHGGPMLQNVINLGHQRGPMGGMPLPAQSLMGADPTLGPGEGAVSWLQNPGQQVPGGPMQAMQLGQHQMAGPGMPGQSMMGPGMGPGQAGRSLMDGTVQRPPPGGTAQSMMTGQHIAAPGQAAVSLLDGSIQAPGEAAVSLLDGTVHEAQAGQSILQNEAHGARLDGGVMTQEQAAAAAQEGGQTLSDPMLVTEEKTGDEKEPLWTSAKEDEELVDPDADRPDFGGTEEGAEESAEESQEEEESAIAAAAARAGAFNYERKKPIDPAYITAGLMAAALIMVGTIMWTQRTALTSWWPGFAALYEKTGLAPKNPGDGLRLAQSGTRLQRIGGVETLVVKGYISNISTTARNVPGLRLQLIDAKNEVVQEITGAAPKSSLDPGASVDYELKLELPDMGRAKSVVVSWTG